MCCELMGYDPSSSHDLTGEILYHEVLLRMAPLIGSMIPYYHTPYYLGQERADQRGYSLPPSTLQSNLSRLVPVE